MASKRTKQRRAADGSCVECGEPAVSDSTRCEYHRDKNRKNKRDYYLRNREKVSVRNKARIERKKKEDPEAWKRKIRGYQLKFAFGITLDDYERMVKDQAGICAVNGCGRGPRAAKEGKDPMFDVDHCHETGMVRGLLCHGCNAALGFLSEDSVRIRSLADYNDVWQARKSKVNES